jgi:hypothetical protein
MIIILCFITVYIFYPKIEYPPPTRRVFTNNRKPLLASQGVKPPFKIEFMALTWSPELTDRSLLREGDIRGVIAEAIPLVFVSFLF